MYTQKFRFFLTFKNKATPQRVEVMEMPKFDGASSTVDQEEGHDGRDIFYGSQDIRLLFWNTVGEETNVPIQLPIGTLVFRVTMALDLIFACLNEFGTETDIDFSLLNVATNVEEIIGSLDASDDPKSDYFTYFSCKLSQISELSGVKTDIETKIDLFATKSINGTTIAPIQTENVLFRAIPVTGVSEWTQVESFLLLAGFTRQHNLAPNLTSGIKDSLVPLDRQRAGNLSADKIDNFRNIRAKTDLTNISIIQKVNYDFFYRIQDAPATPASIYCTVYCSPEPSTYPTNILWQQEIYRKDILSNAAQNYSENKTITAQLPDCPKDFCISVIWDLDWDDENLGATAGSGIAFDSFLSALFTGGGTLPGVIVNIESGNTLQTRTSWFIKDQSFKITATQTGFDSVIKGARRINVYKQAIKSINPNLVVDAPIYDVGGEYYNEFYSDGKRFRRFDNKEFYVTWKDLSLNLQERRIDYQVNKGNGIIGDNIFIGKRKEFYRNIDMGSFTIAPDFKYEKNPNPEFGIRNFNYKYNKSLEDKDAKNTLSSVHTELQKVIPGKKNKNKIEIQINHIRDPLMFQDIYSQGVLAKPTTSLSTDDDLCAYNVEKLPAGTRSKYQAKLSMVINTDGTLRILNTYQDGTNSTVPATFAWNGLGGLQTGDQFVIQSNLNPGTYTVISANTAVLTLQPLSAILNFTGDGYISFNFELTNVTNVIKTSQGYDLIENLDGGTNFGNLDFTIRDNLRDWEDWLDTCGKYALATDPNATITNTFYKNNGKLRTRKIGERIYQQDEPMPIKDLTPALVDPYIHYGTILADFTQIKKLLDDIAYVRGFIRIQMPSGLIVKVFARKINYRWLSELLKFEAEQKAETDTVKVQTGTGVFRLFVDEAGYSLQQLLAVQWFSMDGDNFKIYDEKKILIINPTPYKKVSLNGVFYTNKSDFLLALQSV